MDGAREEEARMAPWWTGGVGKLHRSKPVRESRSRTRARSSYGALGIMSMPACYDMGRVRCKSVRQGSRTPY
jgi:hypothetical protein